MSVNKKLAANIYTRSGSFAFSLKDYVKTVIYTSYSNNYKKHIERLMKNGKLDEGKIHRFIRNISSESTGDLKVDLVYGIIQKHEIQYREHAKTTERGLLDLEHIPPAGEVNRIAISEALTVARILEASSLLLVFTYDPFTDSQNEDSPWYCNYDSTKMIFEAWGFIPRISEHLINNNMVQTPKIYILTAVKNNEISTEDTEYRDFCNEIFEERIENLVFTSRNISSEKQVVDNPLLIESMATDLSHWLCKEIVNYITSFEAEDCAIRIWTNARRKSYLLNLENYNITCKDLLTWSKQVGNLEILPDELGWDSNWFKAS